MSKTYTGSKLTGLTRYKIEKTVGAKPLSELDWYGLRDQPVPVGFKSRPGFVIELDSGGVCWMSEKEFRAKYTPVEESVDTTFGAALAMMKKNIKVCRAAWYEGDSSVAFITLWADGHSGLFDIHYKDGEVEAGATLMMEDILADDWERFVEPPPLCLTTQHLESDT